MKAKYSKKPKKRNNLRSHKKATNAKKKKPITYVFFSYSFLLFTAFSLHLFRQNKTENVTISYPINILKI